MNEVRHADEATQPAIEPVNEAEIAAGILGAAQLTARARDGRPIRIAHAACGTGALACAIAQLGQGIRVVGCDDEPAALVRALLVARRVRVAERVTFRAGSAATLVGDGPFDLVTTVVGSGEVDEAIGAIAPCAGSVVDRGDVIIAELGHVGGLQLWRVCDFASTPRAELADLQPTDTEHVETTTTTTETETTA